MYMRTSRQPDPMGSPCPHCGSKWYDREAAKLCPGPSPAEQRAHLAAELADLDALGAYLGGADALAALRAGRAGRAAA